MAYISNTSRLQLLPSRLHNLTSSNHAPLGYLVGIQVGPLLPVTRDTLFQMTGRFSSLVVLNFINIFQLKGNQGRGISELLHLPGVAVAATVWERRSQFVQYVGVPV